MGRERQLLVADAQAFPQVRQMLLNAIFPFPEIGRDAGHLFLRVRYELGYLCVIRFPRFDLTFLPGCLPALERQCQHRLPVGIFGRDVGIFAGQAAAQLFLSGESCFQRCLLRVFFQQLADVQGFVLFHQLLDLFQCMLHDADVLVQTG